MINFANRRVFLGVLGVGLLAGCGKKVDTDTGTASEDSGEVAGILVAEIQAPLANATFEEGTEVLLQVQVSYEVGDLVEADSVEWSVEGSDWSVEGNGRTVTDLPVGTLQLVASAQVGQFLLVDEVTVTVEELVVDTPLNLLGTIDAAVEIADNSGNAFDDDCNGPISFTLHNSELTGVGSCSAFGEDLTFLITGEVTEGQVSGEMGVSGGEENVPFTGSWDESSEVLTGDFDETWTNPDGSLRLWGSFQAAVN
jgi:hypothetical protein